MSGYVLDSGYGYIWWGPGLGSITIPIRHLNSPDFNLADAIAQGLEAERICRLPAQQQPGYVPYVKEPKPPRPPRRCSVYRFFDAEERLLYVGKSVDPAWRERGHRRRAWWPDVARKSVEWFDSEEAAFAAEDLAIRDEQPLYNRIRTNPDRAVS